jgi:hypothetical protein
LTVAEGPSTRREVIGYEDDLTEERFRHDSLLLWQGRLT